jgi:hypothetical protein
MEQWLEIIIKGAIWVLAGIFFWKVWPIIKDNEIVKKATEIVHLMEETFGGGTGDIKFEKAVALLQAWVTKKGWKIDVSDIIDTITAAVGALHAEQGKEATKKSDEEIKAALEAETPKAAEEAPKE